MLHRDADGVIAVRYGAAGQPGALGSQHNGQLRLRRQPRIVYRNRVLPQRHRRRLKAQLPQPRKAGVRPPGRVLPDIRPRDLEHRPHTYPHRPPVEGVAAAGGQQHGVNAQRRRRPNDRPHIGGVHHIFQHGHPPRPGGYLSEVPGSRPPHGAQHPAGQLVAGQPGQHLPFPGVDGHPAAPVDDLGRLPLDEFSLGEECQRLAAGVQCQPDYRGAFRNENALFRLQAVAQLRLGQPAKQVQLRLSRVGDLKNFRHFRASPFLHPAPIIAGFSPLA